MKSESIKFPRKVIYFEKQSTDRLCGVHCLNALLQGPYFDPVMLSEIGLQLDEMENRLLGSSSYKV
jgi:ataxin-3